jgi:hypothetical protein
MKHNQFFICKRKILFKDWRLLLPLLFLVFATVSCSGGNQQAGGGIGGTGYALVGLTDAAGDFTRYSVNVTALDLYKADGTVVHTLPLATTVDFAQLTSMTEFLTANTVGVGTYTKVVMTLDYSSADIEVDDGSGNAVKVSTSNIFDGDGNQITSPIAVTVNLDTNNLIVAVGGPAHLALDFDLGATNAVTFSGSTPSLYVSPILDASLTPNTNKVQRFRGPLQSVNVSGNSFVMILRPFANALSSDTSFGTMPVLVNSNTIYNISGTISTGATDLSNLNTLFGLHPTWGVIVHGTFDTSFNFTATEVLAGTTVPGGTMDVVSGVVLNVSGSTLTIRGATLYRTSGTISFGDTVTVSTSSNTAVSKQYSSSTSLTVANIMPGQRVEVFGTLSTAGTTPITIDATTGFIRMDLTTIIGTTNSDSTTPTTLFNVPMTLEKIGGRDISLFILMPASPTNYLVEGSTNLLDGATIAAGTPVKFKGFPLVYTASNPDFDASTYIDLTNARAFLNLGWGTGSPESGVFTSIPTSSSTSLILDLSATGYFHRVNREGDITELSKSSTPTINLGTGTDRFRIVQGSTVTVYSSFSTFITALNNLCTQGANIKHLYGWGTYSDSTTTFTAQYIEIHLTTTS